MPETTSDLTGRYITRTELLGLGWGRNPIRKYLKPDIIYQGEPIYSLGDVQVAETQFGPEELEPNTIEEIFAQWVDRFEIRLFPLTEHQWVRYSSAATLWLCTEIMGRSNELADGASVTEQLHEVLFENLLYAHTNYSTLRRQLLSSGYGGPQVDLYLKERFRWLISEQFPWLACG